MISRKVNDIIQINLKVILNDTPSKEILEELYIVRTISAVEVRRLSRIDDDKERNFVLVDILRNRSDEDFFKFCTILKQHSVETVAAMGKKLEQQVLKSLGKSVN